MRSDKNLGKRVRLRKSSIQHKINWGLTVMSLLVVVVSTLAVGSLYFTVRANATAFQNAAPAINALQTIKVNLLTTQNNVLDALFHKAMDPMLISDEAYKEELITSKVAVRDALNVLEGIISVTATQELRALTADFYRESQALLDAKPTHEDETFSLTRVEAFEALEKEYLGLAEAAVARQLNEVDERIRTSVRVSLRVAALGSVLLLIGFAVAIFIAHRLTKAVLPPLRTFKAVAEQYRNGHFSHDHPDFLLLTRTPDEFGDLARVLRDMADDLNASHQTLMHNALHDDLTGLPNRKSLFEHLTYALENAQQFSLLFVDFDHFKAVNDLYGHKVGDDLLIEIGERLRQCTPPIDVVARLGGDEFSIFLLEAGTEEAEEVARRILRAFTKPCMIDGIKLHTSASVGILTNTTFHRSPEDVLRDADTAMYSAKTSGRGRYHVFSAHLDKALTSPPG